MDIFSEGTRCPKICYSNIVPLRKLFSIETFSHIYEYLERECKHNYDVNSNMQWVGELKSAAVSNCKCEGKISMVYTVKPLAALFFQ